MSSLLSPIDPVKPASAYIGGKRCLAKRVINRIESIDHNIYAEPFVGMGGIFLRRRLVPKSEIINDWSEDVANFFRILQRHYVPFMDMIRFQITSRANFEKLRSQDPNSLTDLERAARFLYLQRIAFGGQVANRNFGVSPGMGSRFNVATLGPLLEAIHDRLAGVVIERKTWSEFVGRYDRPGTLFYLDPPYYGNETDYGDGMFSRDEFEKMATQLAKIKGRFLLSINDRPEVREIFSAFVMEEVNTTYTVGGGKKAKKVGELIISND